MTHVDLDLYMDNPHQASVSYPFSSIDARVNADADAGARCGHGLIVLCNIHAASTCIPSKLQFPYYHL